MNNSENNKLEFKQITLDDLQKIYKYTSRFGEGSCQHSPVSMWSLSEKYGDEYCIEDDVLYVLRRNLCGDEYRVYLAPMGEGDIKEHFKRIMTDAASYGEKVKFISLTEKCKDALIEAFPAEFTIEENIDLAEYMFTTKRMSTFSGNSLRKRRSEANTFWNIYGDRAHIKHITPEDFPEILKFEKKWIESKADKSYLYALRRESRMIDKQLQHFDELGLSGIVLRIDGVVQGFGYGGKLSDTFYDAIIEKGNREIPHIYKVLRLESVKQCAMDCEYVNMEEDVGIEGLRALKNSYKPEYLLHKFIASYK
ncbi:DUF2156 domain-containing protein [Butyrivibrio sp. WCD3002]|uniref:DUF2156 domain-containing protein n=1 Tax=Butyrivibrio sp. WCD3002 TaxID=1280676 RepID=UPI0003F9A5C1|nr:phosphatidylglycerol lysyltransferase domain-containing protein [Butyrivibrio sp. WCD3002]